MVETADEPTDGRTFAEFVEQAEAVDGRWNDGVMAEDLYGGW